MADLTKIHEKLGYSPKVKFEEGISHFIDWVEKQEIEEDNYEKSIEEMKRKGLYK
jgi:dTDP-L-rhamnose 4-epimerase